MRTIILGAGVDANIGMPLTGELIPQLAEYEQQKKVANWMHNFVQCFLA